jgi:hypothetical protein
MGVTMFLQNAPVQEQTITNITMIQALGIAYQLMSLQTDLITEWLITRITGIRTLPTMHCLMYLKIALITEGLTTHITAIWMLPTECEEMYCKILPVNEGFLHMSQEYGRSLLHVCICLCFVRTTLQLNNIPHTSQQFKCSHYECADVLPSPLYQGSSCYIHCRNMDAHRYVHADVSSGSSCN